MAYVMVKYDRPTDTKHWNNYNQQVKGWIAQLLKIPGAASFVAYRTIGEASPDTLTMLEFHTVEDSQNAIASEQMKVVLEELRSVVGNAGVVLLERSPFTPEPIRA